MDVLPSAWARLIFQQGCNLRAAGFIFREKCCKCCLPAPAHLDMDLGYSSKSSRNVLMKGSVSASLLYASGTQHLPGSALDCRITLWEGSGSECQRAADYFVIAEQWAGDPKCGVSSTQDPLAPSRAQHLLKASEEASETCLGLFWPCCFLLAALLVSLVLEEIKWFIVALDSFQIYFKQRNLNTRSGHNQNRILVLENDIVKLRNARKSEGLKSLWGNSFCVVFYNSSFLLWKFECLV